MIVLIAAMCHQGRLSSLDRPVLCALRSAILLRKRILLHPTIPHKNSPYSTWFLIHLSILRPFSVITSAFKGYLSEKSTSISSLPALPSSLQTDQFPDERAQSLAIFIPIYNTPSSILHSLPTLILLFESQNFSSLIVTLIFLQRMKTLNFNR
jgi:hypothetical protein